MISLFHQLFHHLHPHGTKHLFLFNKLWNQSCPSSSDTAADSCSYAWTIFLRPDCIGNEKSRYAMSVLRACKRVPDICHAATGMFSSTNVKSLQLLTNKCTYITFTYNTLKCLKLLQHVLNFSDHHQGVSSFLAKVITYSRFSSFL